MEKQSFVQLIRDGLGWSSWTHFGDKFVVLVWRWLHLAIVLGSFGLCGDGASFIYLFILFDGFDSVKQRHPNWVKKQGSHCFGNCLHCPTQDSKEFSKFLSCSARVKLTAWRMPHYGTPWNFCRLGRTPCKTWLLKVFVVPEIKTRWCNWSHGLLSPEPIKERHRTTVTTETS